MKKRWICYNNAGVMAVRLKKGTSRISGGGEERRAYTMNIVLPRDGREAVQVRVTVDGEQQMNEPIDTILQVIPVTVYGSGVQEIVVYFDGVADQSQSGPHDFG